MIGTGVIGICAVSGIIAALVLSGGEGDVLQSSAPYTDEAVGYDNLLQSN